MEESFVKRIFSNPYMNLLSIVIGLIGIILAVYFYSQSKESRDLVYSINPSKALVVDSKKASNIQVLFNNKIISSDIVAVQVAVWNHGKKSIKKGDSLQAIKITTNDSLKILETSIREISRKVTNFSIAKDSLDNRSILLDWDILENNDGAIIQILFSGKLDSRFFINGAFEGQSKINEVAGYDSEHRQLSYVSFLFGIVFLSAVLFLRYKDKKFEESLKDKFQEAFPNKKYPEYHGKGDAFLKYIQLSAPILFIIYGIYLFLSSPPPPPFIL